FRMDAETEQLARSGLRGVPLLSAKRFTEEVLAILAEERALQAVERLGELGGVPSVEAPLFERANALRAELDPGAPAWRLRLAVLLRSHPPLLQRLELRREDQRAVEDALALAPRLAQASDPVEIADLAAQAPDA